MFCSQCSTAYVTIHSYAIVCPYCGIMKTRLTPEHDYSKQPLFMCSYSRKKRFEGMLDRILFPAFDGKDEHMFKFLSDHKPYSSVDDMMARMKLSDLKDKRYGSMHLFATHFVTGYTHPSYKDHYKQLILSSFKDVERGFSKQKQHTPFFNYPWLLRKLLTVHQLVDYVPFVKPIRCDKRNAYYERLFSDILL